MTRQALHRFGCSIRGSEEYSQHVFSPEPEGQMHQSVADLKGTGARQEEKLVSCELTGGIAPGHYERFDGVGIPVHHPMTRVEPQPVLVTQPFAQQFQFAVIDTGGPFAPDSSPRNVLVVCL